MRLAPYITKLSAIAAAVICLPSNTFAVPLTIQWSALRPAQQSSPDMPLPGMAQSRSQGETLAWHDEGKTIKLTGFILPIDQDGDLVHEFMLVPWAGACSHSAAPPPNQLVQVAAKEPFRMSKIYEVVTVTGSLRPGLDRAQLFIMDGVRVLDYGYRMSQAEVEKATARLDPDLRSVSPLGAIGR